MRYLLCCGGYRNGGLIMSEQCKFDRVQDYCECPVCGTVVATKRDCRKVHAACRDRQVAIISGKRGRGPTLLGDRIELRLHKLGITNELIKRWRRDYVKAWVATAGVTSPLIESVKFEPKCGCHWRKEVLNRLDRWVRRKLA